PRAYTFSNGLDKPSVLPIDPIELAISSDGKNWKSYYDEEDMEGIYLIDWDIAIANPVFNYQKINTQDGQYPTSSSFDSRTIITTWYAWNEDHADQLMAVHELQKFLMSRDGYWIAFGDDPSYKYRVHCNPIASSYINDRQEGFQVTFNNYTGMRESVATTLDALEFDSELFSAGMGIPHDDVSWHFNSSHFKVYNPSDVDIDPLRQRHYLKIHFKGNGSINLTNQTTGENFSYSKPLSGSDKLILDGVDPLMNGSPDGINSNHGTISLLRGWNE
ncbi:phage tail family protein, partial [Lactobacillus sp. XV13L]|nr:phage tail family protein [Lactobacillus sp. XV13L]